MIEWSLRNLSVQKIESLIEQKIEKDAITRSLDLKAENIYIYLNFCMAEPVKLAAGTELCVHSSFHLFRWLRWLAIGCQPPAFSLQSADHSVALSISKG